MPDILVLGNFVVDIIGKPIDHLPQRGQLVMIDTLETHVGGNGPNTAAALGKLGADVRIAGRVGDDLYGRFIVERLHEWNVDTSSVLRDSRNATGVTLVAVDASGERSFIHHFGANAAFSPADLPSNVFERVRHVHLTSYFVLPALEGAPAAGLLARAKASGLSTSLDVCWDRSDRWLELLRACLSHVDFFMPSEEEARRLTGRHEPAEMAAALLDEGCGAVILKLGERGCYYLDRAQELRLPAYDVPVRETTGAGDCFVSGFLYGQDAGWDLERALRFGNACGARSVGAVGAVTGLAPAAEVEAWARGQSLRS